jgi:hypothetical protein
MHLVRFDARPGEGTYFRLWPVDGKFGDLNVQAGKGSIKIRLFTGPAMK